MLTNQVRALQKMGVAYINTTAAGDYKDATSGGYNGYYSWPRMGFEGEIPAGPYKKMPPHLQELAGPDRSLLSLMSTPEGRDWWQKNGHDVELRFDLTPGSRSLQTLKAYRAERAERYKPKPGR